MHLAINNVHLYTLASSPRTWQWTRGGGAYCVVRLATEAGDIYGRRNARIQGFYAMHPHVSAPARYFARHIQIKQVQNIVII